MVFSSHLFLFYFLPLALLVYYAAGIRSLRHIVLILLSYGFYAWSNPLFVLLLLFSTSVDYFCGLTMAGTFGPVATRGRKIALAVSIISNLSLLGFFKYFNFATENFDAVATAMGLAALELDRVLRVTLPLGISFYTFQSMSYTIDIYRKRVEPTRSFIDFACYVSLFPQLVAGPIIRFREVADQLLARTHTVEKFARGVAMLSLGLTKKILLANPCGKVADLAFEAGTVGLIDAWYGVVAYAFQIYFDFSAYSDMAIGLGLMLGFVYPKNFDSPYRSESITEFWRRWHMSLSTWLRDYLYITLGGNRKGEWRTYFNLTVVMLLGGLWHGASWNFVVWGALHGMLLAFERVQGKDSLYRRLPRPVKIGITFFIVLWTWVFFRAHDLEHAVGYCLSMLGLNEPHPGAGLIGGLAYNPYYIATVLIAGVVAWGMPQTWDFTRRLTATKAMWILLALLLSIIALTTQSFNPFIYFIF